MSRPRGGDGPNDEKLLALPEGAREKPLVCFFASPVPLQNSHGQITGVQLVRANCDAACALFDRVGRRPCLTALREDAMKAIAEGFAGLVAAIGNGAST